MWPEKAVLSKGGVTVARFNESHWGQSSARAWQCRTDRARADNIMQSQPKIFAVHSSSKCLVEFKSLNPANSKGKLCCLFLSFWNNEGKIWVLGFGSPTKILQEFLSALHNGCFPHIFFWIWNQEQNSCFFFQPLLTTKLLDPHLCRFSATNAGGSFLFRRNHARLTITQPSIAWQWQSASAGADTDGGGSCVAGVTWDVGKLP